MRSVVCLLSFFLLRDYTVVSSLPVLYALREGEASLLRLRGGTAQLHSSSEGLNVEACLGKMKHHSASLVMAVLVAVGLVLLAMYPSTVVGKTYYRCQWNTNDDGHIFEDIDCTAKSNRDARTLKGCKRRCDANPECVGIEWIPRRKGWWAGRTCCSLKDETADRNPMKNMVFCEKYTY
eukprot:TRINITY_DN1252_c0_g1_i1.p1 TRINITY_DN1252_c0_g1~~TRINITY_DN1252_c0_g1_i1.p1  ORF type:complete len:179 (-),score=15.39 TRINITY_DN1252_c0_g1_i1:755-1291(-)